MTSRVLLCILFAVGFASVDCNVEGDILHSWKLLLVDPNNVLTSWDATLVNPCTWFHVTCNSENVVTRIDLGNAGLSGPISPVLANLTKLQYLELYQNRFYGSVPLELGHLKELVSLDLYRNKLTGPIPETFGHLTSLRFLRIFANNLTGAIPSTLGNLTSLSILRLNKNSLTGTLPLEVIELVRYGNLTILDVSNNLLAGTMHSTNSTGDALFALRKAVKDSNNVLQKSWESNLGGSIPKELGELKSLVSLDLYHNNFTGYIPSSLSSLSNLNFFFKNNPRLEGPELVGFVRYDTTGNCK